MDRADQLAALSGPAADQWGLITAAQAKELGLNPVQLLRLTESGLLENVSRGVYLLSASGMPLHLDIKAAWLRLQPTVFAWDRPAGHPDSGVISHATACRLHELGDIPAPDVEITVPRRRTTNEPFVRLRTAPLDPAEITVVDGLPVTTAPRTITDLLRAKTDGGHVGGVIADANRRDLIDLDELADRVQPYARKYGLKATATGHALINHLVEQAGESLTRQEVARASKEGFDAAVRLMAEHPDLAPYLVSHLRAEQRAEQDILANYPNAADLTGLSKSIREMNKRLAQPDPALTEAIRKLSQPDPAIAQAIRNATALPPVTRKALESTVGPAAPQQPTPPPASKRRRKDNDPGDSSSDRQESG
jgi:predicted transcriptional regulator of viral defense system